MWLEWESRVGRGHHLFFFRSGERENPFSRFEERGERNVCAFLRLAFSQNFPDFGPSASVCGCVVGLVSWPCSDQKASCNLFSASHALRFIRHELYRGENKGWFVLLSRTQARQGQAEQEEISRTHAQTFILPSVCWPE